MPKFNPALPMTKKKKKKKKTLRCFSVFRVFIFLHFLGFQTLLSNCQRCSLSVFVCQKLKQLINFTTNALFQIIQFQSKMIKTEFSKSILVPLLCTIIMLNIETLKTFTKLQTRQFESDSKECIQIWKNNERF